MEWITPGEIDLIVPLFTAALAGSLIGFERELRHKAAGISTNMLICAGACLFTLLSARVDITSTSRISANILQGVGFIGAGLILKESTTNTIRGLTSAAGIWMAAAVGMAFGYNYYVLGWMGCLIAIVAPRLHRWVYRKPLPTIEETVAKLDQKEEKKEKEEKDEKKSEKK